MTATVTLRTDAGDEVLDVAEFEARIGRGEVSPQCLVCLPAVTGEAFVPACDLEVYQRLLEPKRAYFRRAFAFSKFPTLTSLLIVINVVVFMLTQRGGQLQFDEMVRYGAKVGPLVADLGELWRLMSANVLHRDGLHLGLNMFVLFNVGGALENTFRSLDYLWLLVFTGCVTMVTSLFFNDAMTIGASGMVFGCLGGVVAFGLKYRSLLPARYKSLLGDAAIPTVLGFLLIGLTSTGVDNSAHVGGLVAGVVAGATMRPRLLTDAQAWWGPMARAAPTLGLMAVVVSAHVVLSTAFPLMGARHDVAGLSFSVPASWLEDDEGTLFSNRLTGEGRPTLTVRPSGADEPVDVAQAAARFVSESMAPAAVGPDVFAVDVDKPDVVRIADRDGLRVRAVISEPSHRTRVAAYFVARGTMLYQFVFLWPEPLPRYAHVAEVVMATARFEEPVGLAQARLQTLLFPSQGPALAALGAELYSVGELEPAMEALAAAVRQSPGSPRYRVALARAALASGEVERACESAKDAVAYAPDDAVAVESMARCELARGRPAQALERLSEARALSPGDEALAAAEARLKAAISAAGR